MRNTADPRAAYTPVDPTRLISRLQAIQHVKFHDVSLEDIPLPFWNLLHHLGGVREVEVHQMSSKSPVDFFRYICSLPALKALSISRSCIEIATPDLAPLHPKAPFCIRFLDVAMLSVNVLDWFLKQNPVPFVHTLRINLGRESVKAATLRQFVEKTGPSIKSLQITLPSDIHTCKCFRTSTIRFALFIPGLNPEHSCR